MTFKMPPQKLCPKCGAKVQVFSHENGPKPISDPRNWYYACSSCDFTREKWMEDVSPTIPVES